MGFTWETVWLDQTFTCVVPGKTLHFKYRSGWVDAEGYVNLTICRTQPSGSDCQYYRLLGSQATWLSQNVPITITATAINISFEIGEDTTQWLDIDDVYVT